MFTCFRWSVWFVEVGLGPAQPYTQCSLSPVYLRVKVGDMLRYLVVVTLIFKEFVAELLL